MEIAGVLIVQRENRDCRAFAVVGVDHWVTQASIPSTPANARKRQSRHERSQPNTMLKGELEESRAECEPLEWVL
jgi:hypothetical protein